MPSLYCGKIEHSFLYRQFPASGISRWWYLTVVNGIGTIRERFLDLVNSLNHAIRRLLFRMPGGTDGQLLISLDDETCRLLADFAAKGQMTLEEAVICWLGRQASAHQLDQEVAHLWAALTAREQQVVALCCLEYSDHEIAAAPDIAFGTARTHLYKAENRT